MARVSDQGSTFRHYFPTVRQDRVTGRSFVKQSYRTECAKRGFITHFTALGVQVFPVSICEGCPHCRWVKRQAIASAVAMEVAASDWAVWCTFTIAPGIERAKDRLDTEIQAWPLQNFHKVCRSHMQRKTHSFQGRDCTSWRYVQCGEYGKRGTERAHYHVVIFGNGDRPLWADRAGRNIHIPEWPHGLVDVQMNVDAGVGFYITKYMSKDAESWHSRSSGYAIGAAKAKERAIEFAVGAHPVMIPTQDYKLSFHAGGKNRRALMRNAMRRDYMLAFADAQGRSLLSYAKHMPETARAGLVGPVLWRRRREFKEKHGHEPRFFEDERIKLGVYNELRAEFGLPPLRHLNEMPYKSVSAVLADRPKHPRKDTQAGRDRIKRLRPDAVMPDRHADGGRSFIERPSVLADLQERVAAEHREAASAPACSCPTCRAAFGPDRVRSGKSGRRLRSDEVAAARAAYAASPLAALGSNPL